MMRFKGERFDSKVFGKGKGSQLELFAKAVEKNESDGWHLHSWNLAGDSASAILALFCRDDDEI